MLATIVTGTIVGFLVYTLSTQIATAGIFPEREREWRMRGSTDPNELKDSNDPNSPDSNQGEIGQSEEVPDK